MISFEDEKPLILIGQDVSASVRGIQDSALFRETYVKEWEQFTEDLSRDYDVRIFSFGNGTREAKPGNFNDQASDISSFFDHLRTYYSGRNVGAVILASDGIYNIGENPVYASGNIRYPIYTVALGDTTVQKDLFISKVNYNRMAFPGNTFPVEVLIKANKCKGEKTTLEIRKDASLLVSEEISITSGDFFLKREYSLTANEKGVNRFRITLKGVANEWTLQNNTMDIFVDVLDTKESVLILYQSPHPDIASLRAAIENHRSNEVEDDQIDRFNKPLKSYSLVILYQLPSPGYDITRLLSEAESEGIPMLFVLGTQTDINAFNRLQQGLVIDFQKVTFNESQPVINDGFDLFSLSSTTRRMINDFPPLISPFGTYSVRSSGQTLINQQIGNVKTSQPLILFTGPGGRKVAVITGENLWKWRIMNYSMAGNHDVFEELIGKTVQYLSLKTDKSLFRIYGENTYLEGDPVEFQAELYNDSYELINDADVKMVIIAEDGKQYPFLFSRTTQAYSLDAGSLPAGSYKYKATAKNFSRTGEFTVVPKNLELSQLTADHQILYQIAEGHDGKMFRTGEWKQLKKALNERDDIKTITYSRKKYQELINIYWIFVAILALLSLEWFVRKRMGLY